MIWHDMTYRTVSVGFVPYSDTPRHATPRHAAPCHATPRHATPLISVTSCHVMPRHATPHISATPGSRPTPICTSLVPPNKKTQIQESPIIYHGQHYTYNIQHNIIKSDIK